MRSSRHAVLVMGCLLGWVATFDALAQDELFPRQLLEQLLVPKVGKAEQDVEDVGPAEKGPAEKVDAEKVDAEKVEVDAKQVDANPAADEGKQKLKDFFAEMQGLLDTKDKLGEAAEKLKQELKAEFQENERLLNSGDAAGQLAEPTKLEDRQKLIVQYAIELDQRSRAMDPSQQFELRRKVQDGFRNFRRAHPQLAQDAEFQQKERELMEQAMQRMRGFDPRRGQPATLAETIRALSAAAAPITAKPLTNAAHPGEQDGAIQQLRSTLRKVLKLKWDGEQLTLDRDHWDTAFAGRTADDIRVDVDQLLEQRGVPLSRENDKRRLAMLVGMPHGMQGSNIERLFHELRGSSVNGSYSRSGSGSSVEMSFNDGSIQARLKSSPQEFEVTIEELARPGRVLRLVDSRPASLQIMLIGDLVHRYRQKSQPEASVSVVEILDDEVLTFKAQSFARLYREQPRFVEERFFALLDHLGIIPPASRFDARIVNRFIEKLSVDKERLSQEVDRLVTDLDADRFTTRDAAYKELQLGLEDYYEMLYAKQSDDRLSSEVRARIKKLLDMQQAKGVSHLDAVIAALGLDADRSYLEEVRGLVDKPAQQMIDQRLAALTNEP